MPIFEYTCRSCGHSFEALVRNALPPHCPACAGVDLDRLLSAFAVNSAATRQASLGAVRRRNAPEQRDQMVAAQKEIDDHYGH